MACQLGVKPGRGFFELGGMSDMKTPGKMWDARYGSESTVYGTAPNAFFAEQLAQFKPGRMLLPGDGEGRNAVHAAVSGWSVRSFDASGVGVQKSLDMAAARGVTVDAEVGDCRTWIPGERFDVIGLFYLHLLPEMRPDFHRVATSWLKPGGTLLLEGFAPGQLRCSSGGPKRLDMLFTEEMVRGDFSGLEVATCQTLQVVLDEGPYHQGPAEVTRLVARRPVK